MRGSREISLVPSLHRASTDALIHLLVINALLQNWSKLNRSGGGPWPEERAGHAACCLNYGQQFPQLLVTGGLDTQSRPLGDVWTLDLERGKWREVSISVMILE